MASRPDQPSPNFVFWVRLAPAEQFENRDSLPCRSFNASPARTCRSCNRSAGLWRAKFFLPSARSEENRNDQDRDDIDDFDHRIDGRSRGIFVGIADGITGDRCRVRERPFAAEIRSEEHTSELQSRGHLVCRLLLEKKKKKNK